MRLNGLGNVVVIRALVSQVGDALPAAAAVQPDVWIYFH